MDDAASSFRPPGPLPAPPLAPYDGPWDIRRAAHLARRAGFGGSPADVARLARMTMRDAVHAFVAFAPDAALAEPSLADETALDTQIRNAIVAGGPKTDDPQLRGLRQERRKLERRSVIGLQTWWLDRMIATPAPLQEKMTLFWHGHFTTAVIQKGVTPRAMYAQNQLFRRFALGDVRELARQVAYDPAMLRYLDNIRNEVAHPNENFAREFMELYTLGIGNYSEADVREAARAWTGYRVRPMTGETALVARLHDDGLKTLLGQTGNWNGDDVVRIVFAQPAAARFFAAKLLAFFVYSDPEPELVDAVATELRRHDFQLAPVMATLLSSRVFYSDRAYRALVKSPVEFVVGSFRLFGIAQSSPGALAALRRMTQVLFYPPNVKGWPGGSAWISSSTVLARENFVNALMTAPVVTGTSWLTAALSPDPARVARAVVDGIVQGDASPDAVARITAYLNGDDSAVNGMLSPENQDQRLRGAAYLTMATPAYQLA